MRARRFAAAVLLGAVAVTGCSDSGSPSTQGSPASPATTSTVPISPSSATTAATTTSGSTPTSVPVTSAVTTTVAPTTTVDPCAVGPQPSFESIPADYATALAWAPDGRLFYAERAGTVRVFQNGASQVFATVATITTEPGGGYSERGLLGLAVSPTFASDHFVYALYSKTNRTQQEVIRWRDCAGVSAEPTPLVELPAGSDCCHKGGRLAFGPDGKLYVTLGEEHVPTAAQDTGDVRGKVLRYNADGSVPSDNPFGAGNPVWAFGLRNPFGIAFSSSGQLAITNNGPSGDAGSPGTGYDTVYANVVRGGGYQWANCYGYGHLIRGGSCGDGQIGPDWSSERSTVVPTGAAFVDGSGPPGLAGHLVFCTVNRGMLVVQPGPAPVEVTAGPAQCQLDVKQGPDHAVYYSDPGRIYRLSG